MRDVMCCDVMQDRERVLRLLFAKINSVSARAAYRPPMSAASDPGARGDDVDDRRGHTFASTAPLALPSSLAALADDDRPQRGGMHGPFGLTAGGDDDDDDDDDGYDA